jgi:phage terminase small subunit
MVDPTTKSQTDAAIKAGYSDKVPAETGSKLVRNGKVAREIEARRSQRWDKARENVHKALERQSQALDAVDPREDPLGATQVSALTIRSSGEYVEKFSNETQEIAVTRRDRLMRKLIMRKQLLKGALLSSPSVIEACRRSIAALEDELGAS